MYVLGMRTFKINFEGKKKASGSYAKHVFFR